VYCEQRSLSAIEPNCSSLFSLFKLLFHFSGLTWPAVPTQTEIFP
jgi:hypothetical protein